MIVHFDPGFVHFYPDIEVPDLNWFHFLFNWFHFHPGIEVSYPGFVHFDPGIGVSDLDIDRFTLNVEIPFFVNGIWLDLLYEMFF